MNERTWCQRVREWWMANIPAGLVFGGVAVLVVVAVMAIELPRLFG